MVVRKWTYLAGLLFLTLLEEVFGNGRLLVPPQRSSLWRDPRFQRNRYVFKNYDDHTLNCGGFWKLHENDGKCGVCGDAWDDEEPRANEAGGMYARGIIGRTYSTDKRFIDTLVQVTSSMSGYFEFNICPNDDVKTKVSRECLEQFPLRILSKDRSISYGRRYFPEITAGMAGIVELSLEIPEGLECTQCVLQWRWHGANNYGLCRNGRWGKGCGEQPEIYNCADIAILPESELNKNDDTMHTKRDDKPIKIRTKTTTATTTKATTTTVASTEAPSTTMTSTTVGTPKETTTTATTAKSTTTMARTDSTTAQSTVTISTSMGTPSQTTSNITLVTPSSSAPEPTTDDTTSKEPTAEPEERPSTETAEPTKPISTTTVAKTTLQDESKSMISTTTDTSTTELVTTSVTSTTKTPITTANLSTKEGSNITPNSTTKSPIFTSSESELKTNLSAATTTNPSETQTTSTTSEPPTSPTSQMSQNFTTTLAAETTPLAEVENATTHENPTATTVTTGATEATTAADVVVNANTAQGETNTSVTQSPNDLPSTTVRTGSLPTEKTDSTSTSVTVITTPDASPSTETSSVNLPTSAASSTESPTTKSAPASSTVSEKPLVSGGIITKSDLPEGTKSEVSLITLLTDLSKSKHVSSDEVMGALSTQENISSSNINVNGSTPVKVINITPSTENDTTAGSTTLQAHSDTNTSTNTSSTKTQAPEADNTPTTETTISTAATTDAQSGEGFIVTSRTTRFVQPTGGRFGGGISVARPTPIDQIVNIDLNIPGGDAHFEKEKKL